MVQFTLQGHRCKGAISAKTLALIQENPSVWRFRGFVELSIGPIWAFAGTSRAGASAPRITPAWPLHQRSRHPPTDAVEDRPMRILR
jgi:hypothetical protein